MSIALYTEGNDCYSKISPTIATPNPRIVLCTGKFLNAATKGMFPSSISSIIVRLALPPLGVQRPTPCHVDLAVNEQNIQLLLTCKNQCCFSLMFRLIV